jgi:drug/metabolite transporter (DMT)-like permease
LSENSLDQSASLPIPSRLTAILQAILVTVLWSSSWVLIKIGLRGNLPPITFAGLRYVLAWLCLIPVVLLKAKERAAFRRLTRSDWLRLAVLGLILYTLSQGAQFLSLAYLPAVMANLLLNLTPVAVAFMGIPYLGERPSLLQWLGVALCMVGVGFYFLPVALPGAQIFGIIVAISGVLTNAVSSLLGREVNHLGHLSPLLVTFVSMGIGSLLMLIIGLASERLGRLAWTDWAIIAWLAVVNTAFAFVLWNNTLRALTAVESSILNSLMMPQIAVLAVIFLGETLSAKEILGLVLVGVGVLIVQLRRGNGIGRSCPT